MVGPRTSPDKTTRPAQLTLPRFTPLGQAQKTRQVSLNEEMSMLVDVFGNPLVEGAEPAGPAAAKLGSMDGAGNPLVKAWMDAITENPKLGATEVWEIFNFTADAHPIHVHQTMFQVVNRQALDNLDAEGIAVPPAFPIGLKRGPESWESGYKDTVIAYPGEITRVKAKFDNPGLFVWHCHLVEHEDNEMMRRYFIGEMPNNLGQ